MTNSIVGIRECLPELIARVESGASSDREIDGAIWDALSIDKEISVERAVRFGAKDPKWLPRYSGSLDAVVALIEQKLPGWAWLRPNESGAVVTMRPVGFRSAYSGHSTSPARALLAACLRAIHAQAETLADATKESPEVKT